MRAGIAGGVSARDAELGLGEAFGAEDRVGLAASRAGSQDFAGEPELALGHVVGCCGVKGLVTASPGADGSSVVPFRQRVEAGAQQHLVEHVARVTVPDNHRELERRHQVLLR